MSSYYGVILVALTVISGVIWLVDGFTAAKKRKQALNNLYSQHPEPTEAMIEAVSKEPIHVDYAKSFFPILFVIVFLRSFLYEPFQIPSASMKPTLMEGDFILVNKFNYGLRLPVTSSKFLDIGLPQRGDVAVFKAPDSGEDYIKRVIGIPGDTVVYTTDKQLYIIPECPANLASSDCPQRINVTRVLHPEREFMDVSPNLNNGKLNDRYIENLDGVEHGILINPKAPSRLFGDFRVKVPQGKYFVMGDNRDNSQDGRFWRTTHFVPEENLVGQAVSIWLHLDFGIESRFLSWIPTGVDFGRVGAIE